MFRRHTRRGVARRHHASTFSSSPNRERAQREARTVTAIPAKMAQPVEVRRGSQHDSRAGDDNTDGGKPHARHGFTSGARDIHVQQPRGHRVHRIEERDGPSRHGEIRTSPGREQRERRELQRDHPWLGLQESSEAQPPVTPYSWAPVLNSRWLSGGSAPMSACSTRNEERTCRVYVTAVRCAPSAGRSSTEANRPT